MALIKEKVLDSGAVVKYWRADMIALDKGREQVNFALLGYHSKEVADNHPQKFLDCIGVNELMYEEHNDLYMKYFRDMGITYKDIDTACYMYAKEHIEFFKDAIDDKEEVQRREALRK